MEPGNGEDKGTSSLVGDFDPSLLEGLFLLRSIGLISESGCVDGKIFLGDGVSDSEEAGCFCMRRGVTTGPVAMTDRLPPINRQGRC